MASHNVESWQQFTVSDIHGNQMPIMFGQQQCQMPGAQVPRENQVVEVVNQQKAGPPPPQHPGQQQQQQQQPQQDLIGDDLHVDDDSSSRDDSNSSWTFEAVELLIECYGKMRQHFDGNNMKKKTAWGIVAGKLNELGCMVNRDQCSEKWRSLKHRYKSIRSKDILKERPSFCSWRHYESMHNIFKDDPTFDIPPNFPQLKFPIREPNSPFRTIAPKADDPKCQMHEEDDPSKRTPRRGDKGQSVVLWTFDSVEALIETYGKMKEKFDDPSFTRKQEVWNLVASELQTLGHYVSGQQCALKWGILRQKYHTEQHAWKEDGKNVGVYRHFKSIKQVLQDFDEKEQQETTSAGLSAQLEKELDPEVVAAIAAREARLAAQEGKHTVGNNPSIWSYPAVQMLIETYGSMKDTFEGSDVQKRDMWVMVADQLNKTGFMMTGDQCDTKWRSLKHRYKTLIEIRRKKPHFRIVWEHFTAMHAIYENDPYFAEREPVIEPQPTYQRMHHHHHLNDGCAECACSPPKRPRIDPMFSQVTLDKLNKVFEEQKKSNDLQQETNRLLREFCSLLGMHLQSRGHHA